MRLFHQGLQNSISKHTPCQGVPNKVAREIPKKKKKTHIFDKKAHVTNLEYPWNLLSLSSVDVPLGDWSYMKQFTAEEAET